MTGCRILKGQPCNNYSGASMDEVNPLWAFSISFYRLPGIEHSCVDLQDRLAVDVNLLLACCWAGVEGLHLTRQFLESALQDSLLCRWRLQAIDPLRKVRRGLKQEPLDVRGNIYRQVLQAEISAEKVAQEIIYNLVQQHLAAAPRIALTLYRNLARYWELLDLGAPVWDDVGPLLCAAYGEQNASSLRHELSL